MIRTEVITYAFYCETHRINGGATQNVRLAKAAKAKANKSSLGHVLYGVYRDDFGRLYTYFIEVTDEELSMLASLALSVPFMIIHAAHSSKPFCKTVEVKKTHKPESWREVISKAYAKVKAMFAKEAYY